MHRDNGINKRTPIGHEIRRSERKTTGFEHPWVTWVLRFLAYALPLGFLLYVLYWNFLPFGYEETFVIDVGAPGDTSGEFYLEPSRDLSSRKVAPDGTTYRELNGIAYAVFKPKAVLKNAEITVSVEGLEDTSPLAYQRKNEVSIIPPVIDFDPDSVNWDYEWDFTNGIPDSLEGDAYHFDGQAYFDGTSSLQVASSSDMFEEGPFSVYTEWTPKKSTEESQQIMGHYNWELTQNVNSVTFQVGRMDNATGTSHSLTYPISSDFFNTKHYALAVYFPSDNGHIDLFIDGNFAGRTFFGKSVIWNDYNGNKNLTFGKSGHGSSSYLKGYLFKAKFKNEAVWKPLNTANFIYSGSDTSIVIFNTSTTSLSSILIDVK